MEEQEGYRDEAAHEGDFEFEIEHFALFGVGAGGPSSTQSRDGVIVE